jgi:hypothetical protein
LMGALAFINYKAAKRYEKRYKLQKEENRKWEVKNYEFIKFV